MRLITRGVALASLLLATASLMAQNTPDQHMRDAAAPLYQRSAFAHGYLHGYEQGFHLADLDIQMGHLLPGVHMRRRKKNDNPDYRPAYGDKGLFLAGFKIGSRAGYDDSLRGIPFRAISELRNAASGLAPADASPRFDHGFYEGFVNGDRQGRADGAREINLSSSSTTCRQQHGDEQSADGQQYCDGYLRGLQVGFDHGRTEWRTTHKDVETAEKR